MTGRAAEAAAVAALAIALTIAVALPVLRAPADRIFGMPIAGHHHDPFTFMRQIDRPIAAGVYLQPATDIPGAFVARRTGPVAAYNWIVLLTFPLSAVVAYLFARHLALAPVSSAGVAVAFAFSPFHLSHAAYHPHVAQIQWIALYLFALWRCLDRPSRGAVALLVASAVTVTLSNFYGGLIAAVMTPAVIAADALFRRRNGVAPLRHAAITLSTLAAIAIVGTAYVMFAARDVVANVSAYGTASVDLVRYGARWWSYLMPPVEHPIFGAAAVRMWHASGVDIGIVEQQVSLGWGFIALALIAIAGWLARDRNAAASNAIPMLAVVSAVAFVCSLAAGPSTLLHPVLPMFRSYARFGVVVQLMTMLLAAFGAERLWRSGRWRARAICVALLTIGVAEYAVWPPSMFRDALPTAAHRWVARQPERLRVFDCAPAGDETPSIQWLTQHRVSNVAQSFDDCTQPDVAGRLAAAGYTHLIVRHDTPEGRWFAGTRMPAGLQTAARFADSDVYAIAAMKQARRQP